MRDAPKRRAARVAMAGLVTATALAGLWLAATQGHVPEARTQQQPPQSVRPVLLAAFPASPLPPATAPYRLARFAPAASPVRAPALHPMSAPLAEAAPSLAPAALLPSLRAGRLADTYAPPPPRRSNTLAVTADAAARPRPRSMQTAVKPASFATSDSAQRPRPRLAQPETATAPVASNIGSPATPTMPRPQLRPLHFAAAIPAAATLEAQQSAQAAPPPRPARRPVATMAVAAAEAPLQVAQPALESAPTGKGLLAGLFRKERGEAAPLAETRATRSALPRLASAGSCPAHLSDAIPTRPRNASGGNAFVARLGEESGSDRDRLVTAELLSGNLPDQLRELTPVTLSGRDGGGRLRSVTVCVMPDYLAVGSDKDFVRLPMGLPTAAQIADSFGFLLPTTRIVDAVFAQAGARLAPRPMPAGERMRTTTYFRQHNETVERQRSSLHTAQSTLIAGQKKDLVLSNALRNRPGRVAIYGWHRGVGEPIQPLSTVHGAMYADYSHGVRLVSRTAFVDGQAVALTDLLADPAYAALLSDEGPITAPDRLIASLYR